MTYKLMEGKYVCAHVQRIQRHVERLEKLNVNFDKELTIDISFPTCYDKFIPTYYSNNTKTTLMHDVF